MDVDAPIVEHIQEVHLPARPFYSAVVLFNAFVVWASGALIAAIAARPDSGPLPIVIGVGSLAIVVSAATANRNEDVVLLRRFTVSAGTIRR